MRPWISDSGQIIVKSIVLEECQESNWAAHHGDLEIEETSVSTRIDDEMFRYTLIGKTDSGLFIVAQTAVLGADIVAYTIDEQTIRPDLLQPKNQKVHI